jgi:uncharacterized protein (DUF1684 family)
VKPTRVSGFVGPILLAAIIASCSRRQELPPIPSADSLAVVQDNMAYREEVDAFFRANPGSPFQRDTSITYHGIRWFPIDPRFCVTSVLHSVADPETVTVYGTKGEPRRHVKIGYFEFLLPDSSGEAVRVRLFAYKFTPSDTLRYTRYRENLSVWFTDRTTGGETYDVGRYLEIGDDQHDPAHAYVIDLNKAYNPYCAYSHLYSCAIPRKEDFIDLPLRVGEMRYHN